MSVVFIFLKKFIDVKLSSSGEIIDNKSANVENKLAEEILR
jgi:hypothetical protein